MLEMRDVAFSYKNGAHVLERLQLQIHPGEWLALCGRNGSGKTTITRLLMGLEKPTRGRIFYNGTDITAQYPAQRSAFLGYVFQQPERQMFRSTVQEEVAYGPQQAGLEAAAVQAAVAEALAATGLTALATAYPLNLNRSEKQRVAIASALAMKTKYLILDEPTSGQDRQATRQLMALLQRLNENGLTVILITHDMDVIAAYCSRVIALGPGGICFDGTPEALFTTCEELYELGLRRPDCVRLSLAVPQVGYCKSMKEFTAALCRYAGGKTQ